MLSSISNFNTESTWRTLRAILGFAIFSLFCCSSYAQSQGSNSTPGLLSAYNLGAKGANDRVWQRIEARSDNARRISSRTNFVKELSTGMHHLVGGQWIESSENIEITSGGAAATNGQHQIYFAGNINTTGGIHLVESDGEAMSSRIMGIGYYDASTGTNVLIAELQDSVGQLLPTLNQALYTNAFTDFQADVRYTYTKQGLEQDVILRQQPPSPAEWNLNPQTTFLQIWTEFTQCPDPFIRTNQISGYQDEQLDFGLMEMGEGKAFSLDGQSNLTPVFKHWRTFPESGRKFLVEEIPFSSISSQLASLPLPATTNGTGSSTPSTNSKDGAQLHRASKHPVLLAAKSVNAKPVPMTAAKNVKPVTGFVLDYIIVNTMSNFTFQADTTYYVSGPVTLNGTTTIEGGAVIKYTNSPTAQITLNGPLVCTTGPYRPAILTQVQDNSVGQIIYSGSAHPTNLNAGAYIFGGAGQTNDYRYLRIVYAGTGITNSSGPVNVWDCQFVKCGTAVAAGAGQTINLHNVLITQATNCAATTGTVTGEQVTVGQAQTFCPLGYSGAFLTNCIIAGVTDQTGVSTDHSITNGSGLFYQLGVGSFYLSTNSAARSFGTPNINPITLRDIEQKTTFSPELVLDQVISNNTIFSPQVARDTNNTPDAGYHYDAIDYLCGTVYVTNAILSVQPGTVVGGFGLKSDPSYFFIGPNSILIDGAAQLNCLGQPTNLAHFVTYDTVQEEADTNWTVNTSDYVFVFNGQVYFPTADFRFADWSCLAGETWFIDWFDNGGTFNLRDCQFHSGALEGGLSSAVNIINCLFDRTDIEFFVSATSAAKNNTVYGGAFFFYNEYATGLSIQNNLFDRSALAISPTNSLDHNAFANSNNFSNFDPLFFNSVMLSNSPGYEVGPLGSFYQYGTSSLINDGSTNANLLGLYEYTVTTNEVKDGTNIVSIGYHYVATDTNGSPLSTLWLGIPDYLVDTNGDGVTNLTKWQIKYFGHTGVDPYADYDNDGTNNITEYINGTDPNQISFSLSVSNNLVNSDIVPVQLNISGGVPSSISVVVNSNFASAVWLPYTNSTVTVPLGTNDGEYDIQIGLEGLTTNMEQIFLGISVVRDTVLPVIAVTNPISSGVSNSVIQLEGYVSKEVAQLTYDLSNAVGVLSNQQIYITGQYADASTSAFTTNYFHGYDIFLASGTNAITIHAIDRAGNITSTNINYVLDYTGDVTPPTITISYPLSNSMVASSNFTLIGNVDLDTVAIVVKSTNATQSAVIDRNGGFSVLGLALTDVTNIFTVIATDGAGNSTTNTLSVLKGSLVLTVNPLSSSQLSGSTVTMTGTISDGSQSVWVNGVAATVTGTSWSATVTAPGGNTLSAVVQAGTSLSSPVGDLPVLASMPPIVRASGWILNQTQTHDSFCAGPSFESSFYNNYYQSWSLGFGGISTYISGSSVSSSGDCSSAVVWPTNWPDGAVLDGTQMCGSTSDPYSEATPTDDGWGFTSYETQRTGSGPEEDCLPGASRNTSTITIENRTKIQLSTGGVAQPGVQRIVRLLAYAYDAYGDIPANQIELFGQSLTATATNAYVGELFMSFPAGSTQDVPIRVFDSGNALSTDYGFYVTAEEIPLQMVSDGNKDGLISFDGSDVNTQANPWRFWIDDSQESGDITSGSDDQIPGSISPNSANSAVNGRNDLVNFFPIAINFGDTLEKLSPTNGYEYRLSQSDEAIAIVYTSLPLNDSFDYLTNSSSDARYGTFGNGPSLADTIPISGAGSLTLSTNFLNYAMTNDGIGLILVEGLKSTSNPLMLEIWQNGSKLLSVPFYLSLTGVEQMFRHVNLAYVTAGSNAVPARALAPNEPISTNNKNLVFIHGYNVNEQQARGVESEMFKRFFWSDSHAHFYGLTWNASVSQGAIIKNVSGNLQTNIVNAFLTSPYLAIILSNLNLTGQTVVVAHSLGNMLALSAISDHGASPDKYFMLDSAVALEAIDGTLETDPGMVLPSWSNYDNRLWATEWHNLYATNDARSLLTWKDRLANLNFTTEIFNFYSSGEEVLREFPGTPPEDLTDSIGVILSDMAIGVDQAAYAWVWQEKNKGRMDGNDFVSSNHGGWKFNAFYDTTNGDVAQLLDTNTAASLSDSQLSTQAFFSFVSDPDSDFPFAVDSALELTTGSTYAAANRDRILSDAIPSRTLPIGANFSAVLGADHNIDMQNSFTSGYPLSRTTGLEAFKWHHSDFDYVAYPFVFRLFNKIVTSGELK
ncbi:MAG TPA: hypothetical protein VH413_14950 [Verrucomicrobiae bacterium]|nr:hypothetical protein [Verrucomicrobiae bacterium]